MELLFESYSQIDLTENHIRQLHGVLLQHSEKDERHRGHYKTLPNHIEAFDERGASVGVLFETPSPFDTPRLMTTLVGETRAALSVRAHHPLLIVGMFVVRFLAIHPFQDGNGRLARVLTTLLLLRAGYSYVPYSSLERVIEENKDAYYLALRHAQSTLDKDESRLPEWISFFLTCLTKQKESLERRIERERIMAALPALDEQILRFVREHGRLTVAQAVALTGANRNTLKLHLRQLTERGELRLHGKGRTASYEPG